MSDRHVKGTMVIDLVRIYVSLFDFSTSKFERQGDRHVVIRHDYDQEDIANEAYCHQLMGMMDALVGMAGGTLPRIEVPAAQWKGASETVFDITWT